MERIRYAAPRTPIHNIRQYLGAAERGLQRRSSGDGRRPREGRLVRALRDADNVCFEICDEPHFGGATPAWQHRIADAIVEAEKDLPAKHLIAQNIADGSKEVEDPHPAVSIFDLHDARPPAAVVPNRRLNKAIADDETGFRGPADVQYRTEGWESVIAGGAIYSDLDHSFTPDHEHGRAKPDAPDGGGAALRRRSRVLKEFIEDFDFVRKEPDEGVIRGGVPEKATPRALAEGGKAYAIEVEGGRKATLSMGRRAVHRIPFVRRGHRHPDPADLTPRARAARVAPSRRQDRCATSGGFPERGSWRPSSPSDPRAGPRRPRGSARP